MSFGNLNCVILGTRQKGCYESVIPMAENIKEFDYVKIGQTKKGNNKIVKTKNKKGWLAILSCVSNNLLRRGEVQVPSSHIDNINIIAGGNFPKAPEFLVEIKDETPVIIINSNGVEDFLWFGKNAVKQYLTWEELCLHDFSDVYYELKFKK